MSTARSGSFNVYGYCFSVRSRAEEPLRGIQEDFRFFTTEGPTNGVLIELFPEAPPQDAVPAIDAMAYTPRNVVYREGGKRFIDYHGRALGIQNEATGDFKLYSTDTGLLYEAAYLYLLSQIGQRLDADGLHRIHALGVVVKERAVLVMLPMGGGKSTLGLHVLQHPQVQILSDDSPFVDKRGRLLAFPLRLGLSPGSENAVPAQHRRTIQRMEFGLKYLVNYSYFSSRVCAAGRAWSVIRRRADHGPGLPDRNDQPYVRPAKLHNELCGRRRALSGTGVSSGGHRLGAIEEDEDSLLKNVELLAVIAPFEGPAGPSRARR